VKYREFRDSLKKKWYVYLLECRDGSYYCGITNNLARRVQEHNDGKGAKYTRGRGPVKLLASAPTDSRSSAQILEAAVKKKRKADKLAFLKSQPNAR
jgi:putative endonuclease